MKDDFLDKLSDEENKTPDKFEDVKYIAEVKLPRSYLALAIFCLAFSVIYAVMFFSYGLGDERSDVFMFILINLVSFPTGILMFFAYINIRYKYDHSGFLVRTLLGKEARYEYNDIISVVPYSNGSVVTYTLKMKNGKKLSFSTKCHKAKQFIDMIEFSIKNFRRK